MLNKVNKEIEKELIESVDIDKIVGIIHENKQIFNLDFAEKS